ncbi:tetratricopeptide repeat protein [Subsaxibacter sp. CAU 1640]|uniref:tetratricopeptide repeat protein n=1 Tax=Subsaxibacter sp. CAU 1640 TaxID=2933271 RepID=UPI002004B1F0|nr:tetratricopeptide repeat protein [Subsaxibacter sp. CAU 1640]MCK7589329.1 tetratricopeptide repeat protein [Subsaxibacter sp. CAU 1640]
MKRILFAIMFFVSLLAFAQNETLFEQGNKLYNDGNYEQAISKYEEILSNGKHSAELYFNLGNAHYKLDHIAPSIFYYEKALQLKPDDKEINGNIAFARNMTIDEVDTIPEVGFTKFVNNISKALAFESWAYLSIGLVILFVVLFLIYYFADGTIQKRMAFVASLIMVIFTGLALSFAFHNYDLAQQDQPAIVFAQESQVKSEPNLRSTESFKLHEGTKVQVLDTVNNWKKIKLADGKTGWISSDDIKVL